MMLGLIIPTQQIFTAQEKSVEQKAQTAAIESHGIICSISSALKSMATTINKSMMSLINSVKKMISNSSASTPAVTQPAQSNQNVEIQTYAYNPNTDEYTDVDNTVNNN